MQDRANMASGQVAGDAKGSGMPTDRLCESLSCLIDGEVDDSACAALVARVDSDPGARREWMLMNLACDALRSSEVAGLHSERFVDRVAAALAREPTILAPAGVASSRRFVRRFLLPGSAVAAAAALLAVVAVPQLRGDPAVLQADSKSVSGVQQVSAPQAVPIAPPVSAEIARVPELERYLMAHRELAGGSVMPRSASYLRTSTSLPREAR